MAIRPILLCVSFVLSTGARGAEQESAELTYAPASPDNPLKGLVPYIGQGIDEQGKERFPHSMEFWYFPLSDLMKGEHEFNWEPIEKALKTVAARGHQLVMRVYLEYPGKREGVPEFLVRQGVKVHHYLNTNTQPFPPQDVWTPDWEAPQLRAALQSFIAAFGARFDGDPRLAYVTAGLLGTWGEWHDYPREDLWASPSVQREVMDAYRQHFRQTPVLLRHPSAGEPQYAPTSDMPFGYHDDSFGWATAETGNPEDAWFFVSLLRAAGELEKWKRVPIGGEVRPEVWGCIFDPMPCTKEGQDFDRCLAATHATWLMESGMFTKPATNERRERAIAAIQRMGYEFHIQRATLLRLGPERLSVALEVRNRGVAPFYRRDYPLELALIRGDGELLLTIESPWRLTGILPEAEESSGKQWEPQELVISDEIQQLLQRGERIWVGIRAAPPFSSGSPVRFANQSQDRHAPGWLTLGLVPGER